MRSYYSYLKNDLERIDKCYSTSRLSAAKHFASKKQLSLEDYLNIYYIIDNEDVGIYKNKLIRFQQNGFIVDYEIRLLRNTLILKRLNIYGDEDILFPKRIKLYKFPSLLKYVKSSTNFIVSIIY